MPTWLVVCVWVVWIIGAIRGAVVLGKCLVEHVKKTKSYKEVIFGFVFTLMWFSYLILG